MAITGNRPPSGTVNWVLPTISLLRVKYTWTWKKDNDLREKDNDIREKDNDIREKDNDLREKDNTLSVVICPVETCPFLKKEASFYRAT